MKNAILFICLLISCAASAQDYVIAPDGTKTKGKMQSVAGNTLRIKDKNDEILTFKVDELSEIYVANPHFNMNRIHLNNSSYKQDEGGIRIKLLDNPVAFANEFANTKTRHSYSETSVVSDDKAAKVSLTLTCPDCADSGKLKMKSEDGKSSVEWKFNNDGESVFPKTIEVDANKLYFFTYADPVIGRISKKIEVNANAKNEIKVFE